MTDNQNSVASPVGGETMPRGRRVRGMLLAAATAFAVAITGLTAPVAAQAVDQPGDWVLVKKYSGDPQFPADSPHGVAVDRKTGDIVFTDFGKSQFVKMNDAGDFNFRRGQLGNSNGFFNKPTGVAIDKFGNIYVADTENHRIQKFEPNGDYLMQWGQQGAGNGELSSPKGIAVDGFGNVYVADTGNSRIQKFSNTGTFLGKWGSLGKGEKQFNSPEDVAVDTAGNLFIADTLNHRIQALRYNGDFLKEWGQLGVTPGQFDTPTGVVVDHLNHVLVADSANKRVQEFTAIGQFLGLWNTLTAPKGIAVNNTSGNVYVTEGAGVSVYRKAVAPTFVTGPRYLATVGKPYNSTIVTGGAPDVSSIEIVSGKLPAGYSLAGHTISGLTRIPGTYKLTLRANNNVEASAVKDFTITVRKAATRVWASGTKTSTSKKGTVSIRTNLRVSAPGTVGLTRSGKVGVYYGSKLVKTFTMYKSNNGTKAVSLPRFKKSQRSTITLRYFGNGQLRPSKGILGKAVTKVSVKLSDKTPKAGRTNIKATIRLKPLYASTASKTGTFKVYFGRKAVKTVTMGATHNGTITVRLPKVRKAGATKIIVRYAGNKQLMSSKKSVTVRAH